LTIWISFGLKSFNSNFKKRNENYFKLGLTSGILSQIVEKHQPPVLTENKIHLMIHYVLTNGNPEDHVSLIQYLNNYAKQMVNKAEAKYKIKHKQNTEASNEAKARKRSNEESSESKHKKGEKSSDNSIPHNSEQSSQDESSKHSHKPHLTFKKIEEKDGEDSLITFLGNLDKLENQFVTLVEPEICQYTIQTTPGPEKNKKRWKKSSKKNRKYWKTICKYCSKNPRNCFESEPIYIRLL